MIAALETVGEAIERVCRQHPEPKARWKAMKEVRWVLMNSKEQFAAMQPGARVVLTDDVDKAVVFDGRDNEQIKAKFYNALLNSDLRPVLL